MREILASVILLAIVVPAGLPATGLEAPATGTEAPEPAPQSSNLEPEELWIEGHRAYEEGRYGAAAASYQELVDRGFDGGWVYYNLGNARLRAGELGRAVAAYRASSALLPRDGDVRANLAFARQSARDALEPPQPPEMLRTLLFWHFGLSRPELTNLLLSLEILLFVLLAVRLFRRDSEVLQWMVMALLIATVTIGASTAVRSLSPVRLAVVTASEIDAHTGTSSDAVVRFKLHAGSELRMIERREGWLRIELPDGQQGWIESRFAEIVTP